MVLPRVARPPGCVQALPGSTRDSSPRPSATRRAHARRPCADGQDAHRTRALLRASRPAARAVAVRRRARTARGGRHVRSRLGAALLEIVTAKGADWTQSAWRDGALAPLLDGPRREQDLRRTQVALHAASAEGAQWKAEIDRLRAAIASQEETLAFLHQRYETLCRIEEGGWWRLRDRLRPALRFYEAVRGAGRRQAASDRRSLAPMQTADAPRPEQAQEG